MTNVTSKLRQSAGARTMAVGACGVVLMFMPHSAAARPYTVVSCDAAPLFGHSSAAWAPFGNAGSAYASCPTGGGSTAGISNRLIGGTYTGYNHSGHAFTAPVGSFPGGPQDRSAASLAAQEGT